MTGVGFIIGMSILGLACIIYVLNTFIKQPWGKLITSAVIIALGIVAFVAIIEGAATWIQGWFR